jgi:hypothetical protein
MKAIILISSIFYILGLKISNKIDLINKNNPVEKIIIQSVKPETPPKTVEFKDAEEEKKETEAVNENSEDKDIE